MGVISQLFGCRDRARPVELRMPSHARAQPSAATTRWRCSWVDFRFGCERRRHNLKNPSTSLPPQSLWLQPLQRDRRSVGRSARPASGLPKTVPRQPPRPRNLMPEARQRPDRIPTRIAESPTASTLRQPRRKVISIRTIHTILILDRYQRSPSPSGSAEVLPFATTTKYVT